MLSGGRVVDAESNRTKLLPPNLVPRVSHLTAPGDRRVRDPGNEVDYFLLYMAS